MENNHSDLDLEEGQEVCPICNEVIMPGAGQFCQHYLWTRWDGEVIWEIKSASDLVRLSSDLWEQLCELEGDGDLNEVLDEVERQFKQLISLARDASSVHPDDFISTGPLQSGTSRQTEGMVSGAGCSEFVPNSAEQWVDIKVDLLKYFGALIKAAKCSAL